MMNATRFEMALAAGLLVVAVFTGTGYGRDVPRREPLLATVPATAAGSASRSFEGAPVRALPTMMIADLELADTVETATLLRLLARLAQINMLISPNVQGTVAFTFRGVPWDQAFRGVVASAGLTYAWQGDVLRVMTIGDLRHELELETVLRDRESVREDMRRVEPMVMRVIPLQYLVAKNLEKTLSQMLSAGQDPMARGGVLQRQPKITADSESNAIVIHAVQADVEKAAALVAELDRPRALIQIEAKIVEASRDTARQLGIQWGGQTSRMGGSRLVTVGGAGADRGFVADFPAQFATSSEEALSGFTLGLASERIGMGELLNLQLTALQRQGKINIQSSPTVTTLDNETAMIESGEERAYRASSGTGNDADVQVEWKEAKLKLEVTPHVVDGRRLRVKILASKDSFDETKPQSNNEFPVNTKRAQTTVLLADGETTMIGGLSLESSSDTVSGVPFLMRIPLLGHLFRSKAKSGRFDETIIFITPKIL